LESNGLPFATLLNRQEFDRSRLFPAGSGHSKLHRVFSNLTGTSSALSCLKTEKQDEQRILQSH
jgi:hypothetical protein